MFIMEILILIILLILSGFFSSAETALFSVSRTRAQHLAKQGGYIHLLILKMKEDPHRLLTTVLIGNNLANIGAAAIATALAINMFSNYAVGLSTGVMTLLILVFGEVLPKSVATRNNVAIAKITVLPLYWFSILFYPIQIFLRFIPKLTGKIKQSPGLTEEELMTFVDAVEGEGKIKEQEKMMIHNIFELDDTKASEIMTPRADMFVIDADEKFQLEEVIKSGYTRIPVIQGDIDHVIGILNIKDIFLHQTRCDTEIDIRKIMKKPYFVPENKKLDRLLHNFKKRKDHMAVVVDEHGGISGLVTLEDALEELVGEISDETDQDEPHIFKIDEKEWIVQGKSEIDQVNEQIGMEMPESGEYDTFSGFFLDQIGRIPKEKDELSFGNYQIIVKKMVGNRIKEFVVKKTGGGDETDGSVAS
ncbi:MAG: hemolysin family protein [Pseudomonadota bacterium]